MDSYDYTLFSLFGLPVTIFALFVVLGTMIGIVMAMYRTKRTRVSVDAVLWFAVLGIPLGVTLARLVFCLYHFDELHYNGILFLFHMEYGGFTVVGAFIGLILSCIFTSAITHENIIAIADTVFPAILFVLSMERFGEEFTENGMGLEVSIDALRFFPFARPGVYNGMNTYAVNIFEGISALVFSAYTQNMKKHVGRAAGTGVILTAAAQIAWESIRKDDRLMLDMASFLMIFCDIILFVALIICISQLNRGWKYNTAVLTGFSLLSVFIGLLQFFMEGKIIQTIPIWLCFILTCLCASVIAFLCLHLLNAATISDENNQVREAI